MADDKERIPDIPRGEVEYKTAREEQESLTIENGLSGVKKLEILEINKGEKNVSMNHYTLTHIRGTIPEAIF